jgi:hypothetical protein
MQPTKVRSVLRKGLVALTLTAPLGFTTSTTGCAETTTGTGSCCRVCTTGKACGDSCISASATCNVGPGCACNG